MPRHLADNKKKLLWIFALSSSVYFIQGIEGLPSQSLFYYMKETLGLSAQNIMYLSSITISAWLIKPIIGYIIDNFLSKKVWIFIAIALDIAFVILLGLLKMPLWMIMVFLVLNSTNAAFRDVSVDGIMCVEGKKAKITGKIQSVQWISINVAAMLVGVGGGYIAEKWDYRMAFLCLIPFYLICAFTAHMYKEEVRDERYKYLFKDLKRLFTNKELLFVALFIFLYKYSPSFGTPLFFMQRDVFNWDKIWIGWLGTISTVFGIIGSIIYYKISQKIKIKKWLFWSVILGAFTTLSYLYYTPVTAIIYDIVYSLMGMFIFIMIMDFMARESVEGFEATSFAFLCSISNLALITSNISGAALLPLIGLKWLIIISSLTSFLCLPLINKIGLKE